jgi:hypothetical protein
MEVPVLSFDDIPPDAWHEITVSYEGVPGSSETQWNESAGAGAAKGWWGTIAGGKSDSSCPQTVVSRVRNNTIEAAVVVAGSAAASAGRPLGLRIKSSGGCLGCSCGEGSRRGAQPGLVRVWLLPCGPGGCTLLPDMAPMRSPSPPTAPHATAAPAAPSPSQ